MKNPVLPRKWLGMLIGLCIFSLVAALLEYQRNKPVGLVLDPVVVATEQMATNAELASMDKTAILDASNSAGTGTGSSLATKQTVKVEDMIPVYLVGAVNQPGIYQIVRGSYLYQLIDQAGGLRPDAAATEINLAQKITENIHIRIPTQAEFAERPAYTWTENGSDSAPAIVNLNQATQEELDTLPGIGPATAKAIVDYRERNGLFAAKTDLMKVAGIKQSRYDAIVDLIDIR